MIDFKSKSSDGLSKAIADAGHFVRFHDNVLECSDEAAVQAIIDAYTLDQARAPVITCIKDLAREKILAFLPDWKQSNFNARMNEINEARFTRVLTDLESAEVEAMRVVWLKAKAIRDASNTHGANLQALTEFAGVIGYDCKTGWPP
jgi:hypothetical protein